MSSDKGSDANVHSDNVSSTKSRSKSGKGHCKRFWWVYLLVLLVIVAVVVPVVILVAVPKIAQQKIDAAALRVDGVSISDTQSNSLLMSINSSISADSSIHATVAGFDGVMYLLDVTPPLAFAKLKFPSVDTSASGVVNISQRLDIGDMGALTAFNSYFLQNPTIHIRIVGDTTVRVSGIARDYPVTFSKEIEMAGFNGFKGISVSGAQIKTSGATTNNFNATTYIPNPTIWTLDVGNATFNNFFNGTNLGTAYINDMILRPGNNSFFISADINQGPVLEAMIKRPYCETGILNFELGGKSVTNHGQNISYLAEALASKNQSVSIDIGSAIKKSLGLSLPCSNSNSSSSVTGRWVLGGLLKH